MAFIPIVPNMANADLDFSFDVDLYSYRASDSL
jgi:hypothetical protein